MEKGKVLTGLLAIIVKMFVEITGTYFRGATVLYQLIILLPESS